MVLGLSMRERLRRAVKEVEAALLSGRHPAAVAALGAALQLADETGSATDKKLVDATGDHVMAAIRRSPAVLCDLIPNVVDAALLAHATDSAARWILMAEAEILALPKTEDRQSIGYVIYALRQTMSASTKIRLRMDGREDSPPRIVAGGAKIAVARLAIALADAVSPDDPELTALLGQCASFLLNDGRADEALPIIQRACGLAARVLDPSDPLVPRLLRKRGEVEAAIEQLPRPSGVDARYYPKR